MAGYLYDVGQNGGTYAASGGGGGGGGFLTGSFEEFETSQQRRQGMKYPEYQRQAAQYLQGGGGGPGTQAFVDQQRNAALGLYQQDRDFYKGGDAQSLQSSLMDRAMGREQPFSPAVIASMHSQNAQGGSGAFSSDRDMIRQNMANSGLSGSGGETRAILGAARAARQQISAGRRDINSRATLENYGATERAQQQATAYLAQQAAHQQAGNFAEANYRASATTSEGGPGGQTTAGGKVIQGGAVERARPPAETQQGNAMTEMLQKILSQLGLGAGGAAGVQQVSQGTAPRPGAYNDPYTTPGYGGLAGRY